MPYKAENWHALSHEQYFSQHRRFLDIYRCAFKGADEGLRQFLIPESPLKLSPLFHLKSSFRSQDIQVFGMTFWSCRKNGSIRNIRLISKSMTSQPG